MKIRSRIRPAVFALILLGTSLAAQFTSEELGRDKEWEEFLGSARMTVDKQMSGPTSITNPYKMALEKDGVKRFAVWKNPEGRLKGAMENWKWEIAAYRLDRYLGVNMVPVTIERRYQENRGSLQLWVEKVFPYLDIMEGRKKLPDGMKGLSLTRQMYIQRAFDDLIYNEDRHANNILITEDWRMVLIDHSRSFRTAKSTLTTLLYNEKSKTHRGTVAALPAVFLEKLKTLTPEILNQVAGAYLTKAEIEAVLIRRDLILKAIDLLVEKNGKAQVIY